MKGIQYNNTSNSVQLSFQPDVFENLAIADIASISQPINKDYAILSLVTGAHVRISNGESATNADFVLPAGVWALIIEPGNTISLLRLSGSVLGQASVIIPK